MSLITRLFQRKESATGVAVAAFNVGQPIWTPRRYDKLAEEGYQKNVIVYRCIKEVAKGAASVPWIVRSGEREVSNHPLIKLLKQPNPRFSGAEFFEWFFACHLIAGNAYIEANRGLSGRQPPRELWVQRPDRMRVIPAKNGMVEGYEYEANGVRVRWSSDPITGASDILHFKDFHPLNDWYGMSPIEAAAFSIDQHNQAGMWNQALLQNGARPSGALVWETPPSEPERKRLEQTLLDQYQSPSNAGRPMIIGGKLDWKEMGATPKDMDFLNVKLSSARDICRAFGVPPVLVVEGEGTYNNRADARLELWEQTIIPLLDRATDSLNAWLVPMFGNGLTLKYDLDQVSALIPRRVQHRDMVVREYQAGLITLNEAREALEYEPMDNGDEVRGSGMFMLSDNAKREKKDWIPTGLTDIAEEIDDPLVVTRITGLTQALLDQLVRKFGADVVEEIGNRASFENTDRVQNYIQRRSGDLIRMINRTTRAAIRAELSAGIAANNTKDQLAQRIEDVFVDAGTRRANIIAQTESTRAAGFGSNEAIRQSGLSMKEWIATQDSATRETHSEMDGQTVSVDGAFRSSSGAEAEYPGGFGVAEEDIGCRCATIASLGTKEKSMSPEERKALWMKREEKRRTAESVIVPVMREVFKLQRDAVLERFKAVVQ